MRSLFFLWLGVYGPPEVDSIWGIWGSYYNMSKGIFYLLKGDYRVLASGFRFSNFGFEVTASWVPLPSPRHYSKVPRLCSRVGDLRLIQGRLGK